MTLDSVGRYLMATIRPIAHLAHPVLRSPAARVVVPVPDEIRTLAGDMLATLRDSNGVGIAAPQVFESASLFIVASRPNPRYPDAPSMEPEVMINPEIVARSEELVAGWEGCLSIPGLRGLIPRARSIRVRYETLDGATVDREFADFVARVIQHEDDHLHGLVFLDRLASPRDVVTEREYFDRFAGAPTPPVDSGLAIQPPPA